MTYVVVGVVRDLEFPERFVQRVTHVYRRRTSRVVFVSARGRTSCVSSTFFIFAKRSFANVTPERIFVRLKTKQYRPK